MTQVGHMANYQSMCLRERNALRPYTELVSFLWKSMRNKRPWHHMVSDDPKERSLGQKCMWVIASGLRILRSSDLDGSEKWEDLEISGMVQPVLSKWTTLEYFPIVFNAETTKLAWPRVTNSKGRRHAFYRNRCPYEVFWNVHIRLKIWPQNHNHKCFWLWGRLAGRDELTWHELRSKFSGNVRKTRCISRCSRERCHSALAFSTIRAQKPEPPPGRGLIYVVVNLRERLRRDFNKKLSDHRKSEMYRRP